MTNTTSTPNSIVVQQFRVFLDRMEEELNSTLETIETLKNEDPKLGYARAVGCAMAHLEMLKISAQVNRRYLFNA
jgi:hypothetical protein